MLYLMLFLGLFFIPGFLISGLINTRQHRFLYSITLSYFCSILVAVLGVALSMSAHQLALGYSMVIAGLLLVAIYRYLQRNPRPYGHQRWLFDAMFSTTLSPVTVALVLVSGIGYHWIFGIYDEIPSDLYQHLAYANNVYEKIRNGGFAENFHSIKFMIRIDRIWYVLLGWATYISGMQVHETFSYTIVTSVLIFMIAVAAVADRIFRSFQLSPLRHQLAILFTVFFVFTQMGINVFSFVRYYGYAPTMINFVVYFSGLVCLLDLFGKCRGSARSIAILVIAVIVGCLVHLQEGLFILMAGGLLAIWHCVAVILEKRSQGTAGILLPVIVLTAIAMLGAGFYIWLRINYNLAPFYHHKVIALPFSVPLMGPLFVLDPNYQFIRVVTIWGVLIYLLFFGFFKYFCKQPLLVVAMLSPLLTVFNPVFADIFMHLGKSTTLWRMCYFIPLHFVAGILIVLLFDRMRQGSFIRKSLSVVSLILMFILLLPGTTTVPINAYAKTTLAKVDSKNRLGYWEDLPGNLRELNDRFWVLVDPVTGYYIEALTRHRANQYKFLPDGNYHRNTFVFDSYDEFPLSKYSGKLLVINLRDGGPGRTGELSGHWHRNVLSVSEYYPQKLIEHLEAYPDRFKKRWSADDITIYYIR